MSAIDQKFSFLKPLKIKITGSWEKGLRRDWKGCAISSEPIVAVVMIKVGDVIEWCKSERGNANGQPIRLLLSPYDNDNLDVQVNYSVGGGHAISRCQTPTNAYLPENTNKLEISTGIIEKIFTVEGSKTIELYTLFISALDVKVGRNGLWSVRKEYQDKLPEPFNKILTHGRNGKIQ